MVTHARWEDVKTKFDVQPRARMLAPGKQIINGTNRPDRLKGKTVYVDGFGDLHSTNVLVQQGTYARRVLVDASLYGKHHWTADATRLLVDLMLRVRYAGADAMLWARLGDAAAYAARLCPLANELSPDGSPVDALLFRALVQLPEYLQVENLGLPKQDWHWQWHVGLAREFVRQGSRPDLMPTHAVLAFMSAAHHLKVAAWLVDRIDFGVQDAALVELACDTAV
jgi:hypothetical protein